MGKLALGAVLSEGVMPPHPPQPSLSKGQWERFPYGHLLDQES